MEFDTTVVLITVADLTNGVFEITVPSRIPIRPGCRNTVLSTCNVESGNILVARVDAVLESIIVRGRKIVPRIFTGAGDIVCRTVLVEYCLAI